MWITCFCIKQATMNVTEVMEQLKQNGILGQLLLAMPPPRQDTLRSVPGVLEATGDIFSTVLAHLETFQAAHS